MLKVKVIFHLFVLWPSAMSSQLRQSIRRLARRESVPIKIIIRCRILMRQKASIKVRFVNGGLYMILKYWNTITLRFELTTCGPLNASTVIVNHYMVQGLHLCMSRKIKSPLSQIKAHAQNVAYFILQCVKINLFNIINTDWLINWQHCVCVRYADCNPLCGWVY